jgi:Helix-turn-helix domain
VTDKELDKNAARRLAIIRHAREVTGNVGLTCRYYGISRQVFYRWLRRYEAERPSVIVSGRDLRLTAGARPWPSFAVRLVHAGCTKLDHQRGTGLGHRPVPSHAGQITGVRSRRRYIPERGPGRPRRSPGTDHSFRCDQTWWPSVPPGAGGRDGWVPRPIAAKPPEGGGTVNRTVERRHDALGWQRLRTSGVCWCGGAKAKDHAGLTGPSPGGTIRSG